MANKKIDDLVNATWHKGYNEAVETHARITQVQLDEACKKQREICAEIITDLVKDTLHPDLKKMLLTAGRDILNAPSPKEKL